MQINTGIYEDEDGSLSVGLRVSRDDADEDPLTIVMSPELAREVAFSLVEESDRLDPPAWDIDSER